MKSQPEIEERLRAAPEWLEVGPPDIERIVRRGRRRLATKVLSSAVVAIVLGVALVLTGTSLSGFRQELRLGDGTTIPKPRIVATIPLSGAPWGVAFDGRKVWVTSYFDDLILGVDPQSNFEVDRISVPDGKAPYELVAGDGSVWAGGFGSLLRIDPVTRRVTDAGGFVGPEGKNYPGGMASGDGAIWLAAWHEDRVVRFDPVTRSVVATISVPNPTEMAFGDGSLWVGSCEEQGKAPGTAPLYRIDAGTNRIAEKIVVPAAGHGCADYPALDGEFVYVVTAAVERDPTAKLWKIDRTTGRVVRGPVAVPASGSLVAHRGVVWVLTRNRKGDVESFLTLVDPSTMRVLARMSVGQNAWRIAVGQGSLWVPAMDKGRPVLFRIAP